MRHKFQPGPDYWSWRCTVCGESDRAHERDYTALIVVLSIILGLPIAIIVVFEVFTWIALN
jgi:uncharacterized protein (DUF983 family)